MAMTSQTIINVGKDVGRNNCSLECKIVQLFWKTVGRYLKWNCTSNDEQINKIQNIHTLKHYLAVKMLTLL